MGGRLPASSRYVPALVAALLAVVVALTQRTPSWYEAAVELDVHTAESAAAVRVPQGVVSSELLEVEALRAGAAALDGGGSPAASGADAANSAGGNTAGGVSATNTDRSGLTITSRRDPLGGPVTFTVAVRAGSEAGASDRLAALVERYGAERREQITRQVNADAAGWAQRREETRAAIAALDARLGAQPTTVYDPLPGLAPAAVALQAGAVAGGRPGVELVQLSTERRLRVAELAEIESQIANPTPAADVVSSVLLSPRFLEPVQRRGAASLTPVVTGLFALAVLVISLLTDRRAPAPLRGALVALSASAVLWMGVLGFHAYRLSGRAEEVRDGLERLEGLTDTDSVDAAQLEASRAALDDLGRDIADVDRRLASPVMTPLRWMPVVSDQFDAVDDLVASGRLIVGAGQGLLDATEPLVDGRASEGTRGEVLARATTAVADAREALARAEPPAPDGLLPVVQRQIDRYAEKRIALDDRLAAAGHAVDALDGLLEPGGRYLLVAGNSAEARAGMGAFLSFVQLDVREGAELVVGDVASVPEVARPTRTFDAATAVVPDGAVTIADADLARHFGHLEPDRVFSRLGLSPRFPASAPVAADLWEALGRPRVDGVLYLDSVGLASLLEVTGPVEVAGRTYDQDSLLAYLLSGQYDEFGADSEARRSRLDEITATVVRELDGSIDTAATLDVLRAAVRQRNLMVWSRDDATQRSLRLAGMAGELAPTELHVGLATMNGKLAPYTDLSSVLERECRGGVQRFTLRTTVTYRGVSIRSDYVDESSAWAMPPGSMVGLAVISLPGGARDISVTPFAGASPAARGLDGATWLEAQWFSLQPGAAATSDVSFSLPAGVVMELPESTRRGPINTVKAASNATNGTCEPA
jgi:hypothetical protein